MMNKLRDFLVGRYACNDTLNMALTIFGCALTLILSFVRVRYISLISWIPFIIVLYRFISKDIVKRQQENLKFEQWSAPCRKLIMKKLGQWQDKDHRYFNCPQCKRTLRVPKNKGKIKISCPHCGREFTKRT